MPKARKKAARSKSGNRALTYVREAENELAETTDRRGAQADDLDAATLAAVKEHVVRWTAERTFQTFQALACTISAELDPRAILRQVLEGGMRALSAERGILFLGKGDSAGLIPVLALNIEGEELVRLERVSRTVVQAGHEGVMLFTQDALLDARLSGVPSVELNQVHSILCMPLVCPAGRMGAIYLDAKSANAFPPNTEQLARAFAVLAAQALENARVHGELVYENARLRQSSGLKDPFDRIVGSTAAISDLRRRALMAARTENVILITGEAGSGRELLARAIHESGSRVLQNFVLCDCSAIHPDLLRGVILGRTGLAAGGHLGEETGFLSRANRGTLYLASPEALGVELGDQLARFLKRSVYRPMGGRRDLRLDVRLILGTSADLEREVRAGRFSRELFLRVQGLTLSVPALREHPGDVPELIEHLLRLHGGGRKLVFDEAALQHLAVQYWPGNVRELEHVVRRVLLFCKEDTVGLPEVKAAILPPSEAEARRIGPSSGLILPLSEWEKEAVRRAIAHTGGNVSEAARLLGVHRNTMVRKVRELRS